MAAFHHKAAELAAAALQCDGVCVFPNPPHTNAFLLNIAGDPTRAAAARECVAEELGFWLYEYAPPSSDANSVTFEVHIWKAGLLIIGEQLRHALHLFGKCLRTA